MSASNQKKIRKEKAMAYMSERQRKEAEEKKKMKRYTITFWVVLALCLCIVLTTVLATPVKNLIYRNTTAVTIGDHSLSAVEVNYFYIDAINTYCNQYSYYISYMIDVNSPLNSKKNTDENGDSWADKFLDMAMENIKSTYQLYDLAKENGHKLTDEELKSIDDAMASIKSYAKKNNYGSADEYLRAVYGNGADMKSYRKYYKICTMASSYYNAHADSLEYDDAALRAFEADKMEQYNSYTFAYYYFAANSYLEGGTKGSDGKTTYTDEEKKAAVETAERLANELLAGNYETLEDFDKAINELLTNHFAKDTGKEDDKADDKKDETTDAPSTAAEDETTGDETTGDETTDDKKDETTGDETTDDKKDESTDDKKEETKLKYQSTKKENVLYSSISSLYVDWIVGKETSDDEDKTEGEGDDKDEDKDETFVIRQEGDLTLVVSESGTGDKKTINGYYVIRYGSSNDNNFQLKNVRHLLVKFEGGKYNSTTGSYTYTDAEKAAAKAEAEKLLNEFKAGAMTEDAFAELANKHSDDGDGTTGGLYEDIYPGQMVTEFEDWCYDESRQVGDVGLIQTTYGWHIMFYVGESEVTYRDFMVENDLLNKELTDWITELVEAADIHKKNLKYVNRELVLNS